MTSVINLDIGPIANTRRVRVLNGRPSTSSILTEPRCGFAIGATGLHLPSAPRDVESSLFSSSAYRVQFCQRAEFGSSTTSINIGVGS